MSETGDSTLEAGVLARRIAHDVRTPTGVIAGVLDELASLEAAVPMVTIARRSVRRLEWIARRMDWVAAITSDSVTSQTEHQAMGLDEMVRSAGAAAEAVGGRRGVTMVVEAHAPGQTIAGGRLWQHVCEEVVLNALRHARSHLVVRLDAAGDLARVVIEDDGPGVTPDRISTLFDDPEHKTIGLWLARRLARAANGDVRHDPVANGGARFFVEVPARRKQTP